MAPIKPLPLLIAASLALFLFSACSDDSATPKVDGALGADLSPDGPSGPDAKVLKGTFGGSRPAYLEVPSSYDGTQAVPLVVILHGYGANGPLQMKYLGMNKLIEQEGVLMIAPNGRVDKTNKNYWNATDACCDLYGGKPDDSSYLAALIKEIQAEYRVDPKRIYLLGHSNGGFMSFRMACDHADLVAAIVSLAGATWADTTKCTPSQAVSVLQIHGDKDDAVKYAGGKFGGVVTYPGAAESVKIWAKYNGCGTKTTKVTPNLDLDLSVAGAETEVLRTDGCANGIAAELWTLKDGGHLPIPAYETDGTSTFAKKTWAFMKAHPKP